jgi:streptogramin lyase
MRKLALLTCVLVVYLPFAGIHLASAQETADTYDFVLQWGSSGAGDGQFWNPQGVSTDGAGNVYVVDTFNNRIQKFNGSGTFLTKWGSLGFGEGQFYQPQDVATDGTGNVYVTDLGNNRIQKFDSSGTFLTKWGSSSPTGITTDETGNVYVADFVYNRIQKFDSSGTFLTRWGARGAGDGQFYHPYGVATDRAGGVYVADGWNHRIQKFDSSGTFLTKWGSYGTGDGQFKFPWGIATDGAGNVYVVDTYNNRIQKFDSSGTFLTKWGSYGDGDGQFASPYGVATDGAGSVYVADTHNNRIQKFALLTPEAQLVALGGYIMGEVSVGAIPAELEDSLLVKIDAALAALDRGDPPGAKVAMADLKALTKEVEAQSSEDPDANKKIPWDTAQAIIGQADAIIALLSGGTATTVTAEATSEAGDGVVAIVQIDADPGGDPNCVALGPEGLLPVAILSSDAFDATQIDPDGVMLAASDGLAVVGIPGAYSATQEDMNADGLIDLVVQVEAVNLAPDTVQEGTVSLGGHTYGGQPVEGTDALTIVPLP